MPDKREHEFTAPLREICDSLGFAVSNLDDFFVSCRYGINHNEAGFSAKKQCSADARVLPQAVLDYDRRLANTRAIRADYTWISEARPKCLSVSPLVGLC
jgi:hypothetical protein